MHYSPKKGDRYIQDEIKYQVMAEVLPSEVEGLPDLPGFWWIQADGNTEKTCHMFGEIEVADQVIDLTDGIMLLERDGKPWLS